MVNGLVLEIEFIVLPKLTFRQEIFHCAKSTLAMIELHHMLTKRRANTVGQSILLMYALVD